MTVTLLGRTKFEWGEGSIVIIRIDSDYFAQRDASSEQEDADEITASLALDLLTRNGAKPTTAGKAWLAEQARLKTLYKSLAAPEIPPGGCEMKETPFHQFLDDVQYFSEGEIVLCRECYSREDAAEMIAKEEIESYGTDENMTEERLREIILGELKESFVRYGFPPEGAGDGDNEAAWFVGATGRGSKAVWVYE